jgi:hypothetical protein
MAAPRTAKHYRSNDDTAVLDADMRPDDLIAILSRLHFAKGQPLHLIGIDSGVRDYLVSALRRKSAPLQR